MHARGVPGLSPKARVTESPTVSFFIRTRRKNSTLFFFYALYGSPTAMPAASPLPAPLTF